MPTKIPASNLLNLASAILASVVKESFPSAELLGGGQDGALFHYDFKFDHPFDSKFFPMLEEKARALIERNPRWKLMEMVRENGIDFLLHQQLPKRAEAVKDCSDILIPILNFEDFYDYFPAATFASFSEIGIFKLLKIDPLPLQAARVTGTCSPSKKDLKIFLKKYGEYQERAFESLAPQLNIFDFIGPMPVWLPKGIILKNLIKARWISEIEKEGFVRISTNFSNSDPHAAIFSKKGWTRIAEWKEEEGVDRESIFCSGEDLLQVCISSLQFIAKIVKLYEVRLHWRLIQDPKDRECYPILMKALEAIGEDYSVDKQEKTKYGSCIEARLTDLLGRERHSSIVYLGAGPIGKNRKTVKLSVLNPIESVVALVVEQYAGEFPLWLAPEQIRVIPIDGETKQYAEEIQSICQAVPFRTGIDISSAPVSSKIYEAKREKIPFLLVVGQQEQKRNCINVRAYLNDKVSKNVKIEHFLTEIVEGSNKF